MADAQLVNILGQKFGRLTVLARAYGKGANRSARWLCRCDCGREKVFRSQGLRSGHTRSCGCIHVERLKKRRKNDVGERYGRLEIIAVEKNERGETVRRCRCDCGKIIQVRRQALRSENTRSCGCLSTEVKKSKKGQRILPPGQREFNILIDAYQRSAEARGHAWNLTEDEFRSLIENSCYYCGAYRSQNIGNRARYKEQGLDYSYVGIDRVDSTKGYSTENCVPCCGMCNMAKRTYTVAEFLSWANRVAAQHPNKAAA